MAATLPVPLELVLSAEDDASFDAAWAAFLKEYSGLILHVARLTTGDHDSVMDRYLFVIDALRQDRCRRLRTFSAEGRGAFTTWLVAVSRRLCIDEHRLKYGRTTDGETSDAQLDRRRIADLDGGDVLLESLESALISPDARLVASEVEDALINALASLDASDRLLIKLRYEDSLPAQEIARITGEGSQFRVYRRIDRILTALRRQLGLVGISESSR